MCILAIASAGVAFPRDTLNDMFRANPDGAGWAYAKDGKIYYAKGYTSANKFIKAIQKLPTDVERMIHCRIATHGGISKGLTHPFPLTGSYGEMERLSGTLSRGYVLAHNGVLSNFTTIANHSDTEELVKALYNTKCDIMREDMRPLINAVVSGSRVAILNTDGKINRYGTGWTQCEGLWVSNTYYKHSRASKTSALPYSYGWDDDGWSYSGGWYSSSRASMPKLEELTPIEAGEVIKRPYEHTAYINAFDGSYYVDERTGKVYGAYNGVTYNSTYAVCDMINCNVCTYKCPLKEEGGA